MNYSSQEKALSKKELAEKVENLGLRIGGVEHWLEERVGIAAEVLEEQKESQARGRKLDVLSIDRHKAIMEDIDDVKKHRRSAMKAMYFEIMIIALGFLGLSMAITFK